MKRDISSGESIISETGNWNVAADFARAKIMIPLSKCDYYEDIAKFGYESVVEELMNYQVPNDFIRYTGLKRLINELLKICKNTMFAMKKEGTKKKLMEYEKQLKQIQEIIPLLVEIKNDNINKTKSMKIIPKKFDKALDVILSIKSSINIPLNKNHLIFTDKEEFDASAFKKNLKERMTGKG